MGRTVQHARGSMVCFRAHGRTPVASRWNQASSLRRGNSGGGIPGCQAPGATDCVDSQCPELWGPAPALPLPGQVTLAKLAYFLALFPFSVQGIWSQWHLSSRGMLKNLVGTGYIEHVFRTLILLKFDLIFDFIEE